MGAEGRPCALVVEDEPILLRLLELNLRLGGFDVVSCASGEEALEAAVARPPDVVVLDVALPGIDGFEVLRRLRGAPATADVPIVIATAQAQDEDVRRGYALGVQGYVTKPFEPPSLVAVVRAALAERG